MYADVYTVTQTTLCGHHCSWNPTAIGI